MAQVYGAGQLLFVPSSTANAAHLEVILGLVATSSLVETFGGNYLYIPGLRRPDGQRREPNLVAVKRLSSGPKALSAAAIARMFRVSIRTIYHKRAEIRRRERLGIALTARAGPKTVQLKNARERSRPAGRVRSLDVVMGGVDA